VSAHTPHKHTHTHTYIYVYRSLLVAERGARQVGLFKSRMPLIPLQGEEVWCNINRMLTSVCVCVCVCVCHICIYIHPYIHVYIGVVEHSQDDTNGASGARGAAEGVDATAGAVPTNVMGGVRGTRQKRKASNSQKSSI